MSMYFYTRCTSLSKLKKEAVFLALSSTIRLRIVEFLSMGPASVNQIVSGLGYIQPRISSGLSILQTSGIVDSIKIGREKFYRLSPEYLEDLVGWLDSILHSKEIAEAKEIRVLSNAMAEVHYARTCYDHLAGIKGVDLLQKFVSDGWLIQGSADREITLTEKGREELSSRNIEIPIRKNSRRRFAYACMDWTVRSYHLGGALGASIFRTLEKSGYVVRIPGTRKVKMQGDLEEFFR